MPRRLPLLVALIAAMSLASCQTKDATRPTADYGFMTAEDAWLTFQWACQSRNVEKIRQCLAGDALAEFEDAVKAAEAEVVRDMHFLFVRELPPGAVEWAADLAIVRFPVRKPDDQQLIMTVTAELSNIETRPFKLPRYKVTHFVWGR